MQRYSLSTDDHRRRPREAQPVIVNTEHGRKKIRLRLNTSEPVRTNTPAAQKPKNFYSFPGLGFLYGRGLAPYVKNLFFFSEFGL